MSLIVFVVVLAAALLHASWNAIVKAAGDKFFTTIMVTVFAAALAAALLPFLRSPNPSSWPFACASAVCQIVYFFLVARTYQISDMSETYPLMRGTAPLLVATVSAFQPRQSISLLAWIGISGICLGIISMTVASKLSNGRGARLALLNALVIAGYTLIDGFGVRRAGAPAAYTLWIFLLTGVPLALWAFTTHRSRFLPYLARHWHLGMAGGIGACASYGLALWAMTLAPVAVVAALRETSILFGVLIAGVVLGESVSMKRLLAAGIIACGAIILRLA